MINRGEIQNVVRTLIGDTMGITFNTESMNVIIDHAVDEYSRHRPITRTTEFVTVADQELYDTPMDYEHLVQELAWGPDSVTILRQFYTDLTLFYGVPVPLPVNPTDEALIASTYDRLQPFGERLRPQLTEAYNPDTQTFKIRYFPAPKDAGRTIKYRYACMHTPDVQGSYESIPTRHKMEIIKLVRAYMEDAIALELEKRGNVDVGDTSTDHTASIGSLRRHAERLRNEVEQSLSEPLTARG